MFQMEMNYIELSYCLSSWVVCVFGYTYYIFCCARTSYLFSCPHYIVCCANYII